MFENQSLFAQQSAYIPLAERMRPKNLQEFKGQASVLGSGKYLSRIIDKDNLQSIILYGPAGTGKTTLAKIIANHTQDNFEKINATIAGVNDVRQVVAKAQQLRETYGKRTILFIDEIHRFNKSQQDILLPYIENGLLILIGATTENPYFELNAPLLSRTKIIRLESLDPKSIQAIIQQALLEKERGLGNYNFLLEDDCAEMLATMANGDARSALNLLEQLFLMFGENCTVTKEMLVGTFPEIVRRYDKKGDEHYNVISAFIKSMRGSDANAAVHYLARMLDAGESVDFIARRLLIFASEDIGMADPQAVLQAAACAQAVHSVGMPEASIILSHTTCYMALAPKSNTSYIAIKQALSDVRNMDCGEVPNHLKDAHYPGAAKFGFGADYKYPHDYPQSKVAQQYLPDKIKHIVYYKPK